MIVSTFAALALAASECVVEAAADAPFHHPLPPAVGVVDLVVEIRYQDGDPALVQGILAALSTRGLAGTLVIDLPAQGQQLTDAAVSLGSQAVLAGHEVAVRIDDSEVSTDPYAVDGPLRKRRKAVEQAVDGRVRAVVTDAWGKVQESHLSRAGFRAILTTAGPATPTPRLGMVFDGQPRVTAILMAGPWAGPCGRAYDLGPFTPLMADRAAQSLHGASRIPGTPIVRLGLDDHGQAEEAEVFARWLDEVLAPAGVGVVSASTAQKSAMVGFRRPGQLAQAPEATDLGGRLVGLSDIQLAAAALIEIDALPRVLPGDLSLSEAFQAFALVVAGRAEGDMVRLGALAGPRSDAPATLTGPLAIDPAALSAVIHEFVGAAPTEIPAAMPVGDRLWTAGELLVALASVVRGDDPPMARPVTPPDPNAEGLGWGAAVLP